MPLAKTIADETPPLKRNSSVLVSSEHTYLEIDWKITSKSRDGISPDVLILDTAWYFCKWIRFFDELVVTLTECHGSGNAKLFSLELNIAQSQRTMLK